MVSIIRRTYFVSGHMRGLKETTRVESVKGQGEGRREKQFEGPFDRLSTKALGEKGKEDPSEGSNDGTEV